MGVGTGYFALGVFAGTAGLCLSGTPTPVIEGASSAIVVWVARNGRRSWGCDVVEVEVRAREVLCKQRAVLGAFLARSLHLSCLAKPHRDGQFY